MTASPQQTIPAIPPIPTRRDLIVRDSVTFLALCAITAVLFGITWLLFRSFTAHRDDLARTWSIRGRDDLAHGDPARAILALRTALSYAPEDHEDELLLAEALGAAGHTQEATAYFLGLWESRPGDGFINLQLARLARKTKDPTAAINYYRAAIFGSWQGQAVERRRDIRIELADYLVERKDPAAARAELLIAGSNLPADSALENTLAAALLRADDPGDALTYYRKALTQSPNDRTALDQAGRLAYASGDYAGARSLLTRALHEPMPDPQIAHLVANADRLIALNLSHDLPARERANHLLEASTIAKTRLDTCASTSPATASALAGLTSRWAPFITRAGRNSIARDPDAQDDLTQLIADTERSTAQLCGPPKANSDDALLLQLISK